jgi:hypothetical protein
MMPTMDASDNFVVLGDEASGGDVAGVDVTVEVEVEVEVVVGGDVGEVEAVRDDDI